MYNNRTFRGEARDHEGSRMRRPMPSAPMPIRTSHPPGSNIDSTVDMRHIDDDGWPVEDADGQVYERRHDMRYNPPFNNRDPFPPRFRNLPPKQRDNNLREQVQPLRSANEAEEGKNTNTPDDTPKVPQMPTPGASPKVDPVPGEDKKVDTEQCPPLMSPIDASGSADNKQDSYPHLTRAILPTYKGRVLAREEDESGERYIDKAAVFVGRLVKSQENDQSLFQRFSKYGRICGIEYNPKVAQSTYATARILFADEDAALQAIEHEQGGVSFGSAIKVEVRRVLPMDVHMRETFIDEKGRPISPSMVSQYSPPSEPQADPKPIDSSLSMITTSPNNPPYTSCLPTLPPAPLWYPPYVSTGLQPPTTAPLGPAWVYGMPTFSAPPMPILYPYPQYYGMYPLMPMPGYRSPFIPPPTSQTSPLPASAPPLEPSILLTPPDSVKKMDVEVLPTVTGVEPIFPDSQEDRPKIIGFKMVNGAYRPEYEPESLRRYQAGRTSSNSVHPASPLTHAHKDESKPLDLLPIHTGGHDPQPDQMTNPCEPQLIHLPIPFASNSPYEVVTTNSAAGSEPRMMPSMHTPRKHIPYPRAEPNDRARRASFTRY